MSAFNPAPTAAQVQDRFNDVRKAGKGFIPPSAKFVLSHGRQAERLGKNAWMLVENFQLPELHQNPTFWLGRKWTRRQAYDALTGILHAYKQ
jgi:hypothetical protein